MSFIDSMQARPARRWLRLQSHRYLGLSADALLAVGGTTGSIWVFYEELQEIRNTGQMQVSVPPSGTRARYTLDALIAATEARNRPEATLFKVYYPRHAEGVCPLLYATGIIRWL